MSKRKKYYAVCVGHKPGLYTEWDGHDGANEQISGVKSYNQKTGYLACNDLNEAVEFLRNHTLRIVQSSFCCGKEISFEEMVKTCPLLAAHLAQTSAQPPAHTPAEAQSATEAPPPFQPLDASRILREPVSDRVNDFCRQNGFSHLSDEQRRAVQAVNGKFLLFAVPGSGKTTVMMARAGYMVHSCGIPASQLMNMTFTRASAKEMRERYRRYFPNDDESSIPEFRTIHSFCMGIVIPQLRRAGYICPKHVINEDSRDKRYRQRNILKAVLTKQKINNPADEAIQDTVQAAFSSIKNRRMTVAEYSQYALHIADADFSLKSLFESYQARLKELDCMDYDDMLVFSLEGLQENPQVLRNICSIYKYWSIDEAQDNSPVQNDLLDLLCSQDSNLFMVGDDDQSIYSFRGAAPNMLLSYGNRSDVHPLVMGVNYRSHRHIVDTARAFIEHNMRRADKQMHAQHSETGLITLPLSCRNNAQQYEHIMRAARECQRASKHLGVLYQLNASALPLIVHMHRSGIPFESSRGLAELRQNKIIRRAFHLLRLANHPTDMEVFLDCHRDLGLYCAEELRPKLEDAHLERPNVPLLQLLLDCIEEDDEHRQNLQKVHCVLTEARGKTPAEALSIIQRKLADRLAPKTLSERLYLYGVLSICDLYPTLDELFADLDRMEKREKPKQDNRNANTLPDESDSSIETDNRPIVSLSTIHSAKGREWEHVVLIDAFEEVFPGKPRPDQIGFDPEEASRLFYVAVTRAIERLDILTTDAYHDNIEPASSFIGQYAYEADRLGFNVVQNSSPQSCTAAGVLCKLEPGRYYSVPFGPEPGVYTRWEEVKQMVKTYGPPADMQPKKHDTFHEAWARACPGKPLPQCKETLAVDDVRQHIKTSGNPVFNHALDLPEEVTAGLLRHLNTTSLQALPPERLNVIIAQSRFAWNQPHTIYHGKTDAYAVAYMPTNFYKVWLLLWKLLEADKLPTSPTILEIGPGPGTSTWSLIEFYRKLAISNPNMRFDLRYTTVEREPDFSALFHTIEKAMLDNLPRNMSVRMEMLFEIDAFEYINTNTGNAIDLLIESNVLNAQEDFSVTTREAYLTGLQKSLRQGGYALLIEPCENLKSSGLSALISDAITRYSFRVFCQADKAAVYLDGITLFHDALAAQIRFSSNTEHWFSYAILTANEGGAPDDPQRKPSD